MNNAKATIKSMRVAMRSPPGRETSTSDSSKHLKKQTAESTSVHKRKQKTWFTLYKGKTRHSHIR